MTNEMTGKDRPSKRRPGRAILVLAGPLLAVTALVAASAPTDGAAGAAATVSWTFVSRWHGYLIDSVSMINDAGVAVVGPTSAAGMLWFDPTTATTSDVVIDGVARGITDLNQHDEIVGDPIGGANESYYLNLRTGAVQRFPAPAGSAVHAMALNDAGMVVGSYGLFDADAISWYWKPGDLAPTTIANPAGAHFSAVAVNNSGTIAGGLVRPGQPTMAAVYDPATASFTEIGPRPVAFIVQLSDTGVLLVNESPSTAWYWSPVDRQQHALPGPASGVSTSGLALFDDISLAGGPPALYSTATGAITPLAAPPGETVGAAFRINDLGQSVGDVVAADGSRHMAIWDAAGTPTDLGTPPGASRASGGALNNVGQVGGQVGMLDGSVTTAIATVDESAPTTTTTTSSTTSTTTSTTAPPTTPPSEAPVARAIAARVSFAG